MSNYQPLTRAIAEQIGNDFTRLHELLSQTVETPQREQEIAALQNSIASAMLHYGPELLGAWHLQKREYEPMMGVFATILARTHQILDQRTRAAQPDPVKEVPAKNIVTLS